MTGEEIRQRIEANNLMIEKFFNAGQFTLNEAIKNLLDENAKLQKECPHEFHEGHCIHCYKEEN